MEKIKESSQMKKETKESIVDTIMNKPKFYCLQKFFDGGFDFIPLESKEQDKAWVEIEEGIATNSSQEWLLTLKEVNQLIKILQEGIQEG